MASQGQGNERRPLSIPNLNSSHLNHKSWGSDDWQRLLSTHFSGGEDCVPLEPFNGLTEGVMLSELFSNLGTGEDGVPLDPSAPLFSEDTMNALLGEQLRETAAQVCQEMGQQQQQNQPVALQQQSTAMEMQSVLSGNSTSSMMSLHEVTAAMQTHQHQAQPHLAPTTTATMTMPVTNQQGQHSQQQPQPQQYLTLLDGKILHQADGSAVLTSVPSGGQPLAVALPGSTSVLQYIPVLNSQVVAVPQVQVQPSTITAADQQQQQQQLAVAAMAAATLSDGSGAVLPTTSGTTPPATTPTSAAAANAVYTSEISTTQQLVATAAAQQQWLQQEAANVANAGGITGATNAANIAMREAASAVADMAHQNNTIASMTGTHGLSATNGMAAGSGSAGGQISPRTMAMPPPPPRAPRRSLDAVTMPVQPPSLTPQLRPATTEPFPSLTAAVVAAAQAGQDTSMGNNTGDITASQAPQPHAPPLLRPAATPATEIPDDGQLPRKPSHKRERSLRSANPITADPTTAPTIKCAKGHSGEDGGVTSSDGGSGLGTSPDSCILAATVAASTGGSSGDVSPLNGVYTRSDTMPEPPLATQQPSMSAPESTTTTADANNSGSGNTNAASFEVDDDVMALMQAALTPKTGKRRGRPPGTRVGIASADEPREPTDAEILESLLKEDPTRRQLPVDELKKLVRKEKNRISAATSRNRTANYTAALESRVKALQAEQAELSGWLQAPPQALPHRVMLVGPAAAAAASAGADATGRPPVRHLSL